MILKTETLPHQREAIDKLQPIRVGALFMEMGTGKSRTAIELVNLREHRVSNVIWFCPVSLKLTIYKEIIKHTDCVNDDIYMFDQKTNEKNIPNSFWHIIGIESMSLSSRIIWSANKLINEDSFVIVDESSFIKGHKASRTNWITDISERARYRLILTGTPISQGVVDLFSQMRFLSPKILGYRSFYSFANNHLEYSEKYPGLIVRSHNTEYIAAKIKPYVYQVTKEECLELPSKLYEARYFSMTSFQRRMYERVKDEILMNIDYDDFDSVTIFRLFTALQQVICGFWNRKIDKSVEFIEIEHERLGMLDGIISEIGDQKIIIWAKYRYDIDAISRLLIETHGAESVALFHGGLNEKNRNQQIEKFRKEANFFLATPSCGGHGLTLNEASHVIFYNNGFKYAERLQAEDRNHRIGQQQKVTYVDIVCSDSIDERIQTALHRKANVADEFKKEVDKIKGQKLKLKEMLRRL